jgi:hypothetical protein
VIELDHSILADAASDTSAAAVGVSTIAAASVAAISRTVKVTGVNYQELVFDVTIKFNMHHISQNLTTSYYNCSLFQYSYFCNAPEAIPEGEILVGYNRISQELSGNLTYSLGFNATCP